MTRVAAEYVLPLRRPGPDAREDADLARYLRRLVRIVDVTVVDSSPPAQRARHRAAWPGTVRQLAPQPWPGRNGKVAAVVTGVRAARHEVVVIADDDVRYGPAELAAVVERLAGVDLVRPQNVFDPAPWHARWDTARTLLNRAFSVDHPGTFGLRRSTFLAMGGYDGDVLFENLELARTVAAAGGTERRADDVAVPRRPPTARHFLGQRLRQAYDDLAQPGRLVTEASVLPLVALALHRAPRSRRLLLAAVVPAGVATAFAEVGRRRRGGARMFPPTAALWAPAWVAERAVFVWLALAARLRGGVRYSGGRLRTAGNGPRRLRDRQLTVVPLPLLMHPAAPSRGYPSRTGPAAHRG